MSISFCVLGSGSAGNSTLVTFNGGTTPTHVLIDAGLSPRGTAKRLAPLGVSVRDIHAILLTHLDTDHFCPGWLKVIQRDRMRVFVHRQHRHVAWQTGLSADHVHLFTRSFQLNGCAAVQSFLMAHDDLGTAGFVVEHDGLKLGYATDLGRVPEHLFEHFENVNALAIESNYDRQMQETSGRPPYLKRRIMGGRGHLSNIQSLQAVLRISQNAGLSHIALLHLSRQCNDPALVRQLYRQHAPTLLKAITITNQQHPSPVLVVSRTTPTPVHVWTADQQLPLFQSCGSAGEQAVAASA
jgi:phosphoribosyl 1,2-cyclic phosphodiesterase